MYLRAIAVAGLVLLGACSDPDVKEPTPKPTASASPSPTPPTMPAQAKENSSEGAAAFVSYWVDVFNYAAKTGDVRDLKRLSANCAGCDNYARSLSELPATSRPSGDLWKVGRFKVRAMSRSFRVEVQIKFRSSDDELQQQSLGFTVQRSTNPRVTRLVRVAA